MLRILAINNENQLLINPPLDSLFHSDIEWYWVDFNIPSKEETDLLTSYFHFHPLAVEDCLHFLQRPKLQYYENHSFFIVHAIDEKTLEAQEVNMFIAEKFIVSFHFDELDEINEVWTSISSLQDNTPQGPIEIGHKIIDKIVDTYFPINYEFEEQILSIENKYENRKSKQLLIKEIFLIRGKLLQFMRTVIPMKELLYRILESKRLTIQENKKAYFHDIYDHLLKLSDMIEFNREMTSEIRDNYLSLNSYRMNNIMKTLTVITTIFMPLTFIAGVYGMNFENMPELKWHFGYFFVLAMMFVIGSSMFLWFKYKRWFDND
jgi:magnesium transporter